MPYRHMLRSRQRSRRAILAAVVLAFGLTLFVTNPARILGWTGLGFGSLTVPETTAAAVDEEVATAGANVRTPPLIEQYTFPAYAEWRDLEVACNDCYSADGIGAELDEIDATAMSQLELAAHVAPGVGAASAYSRGRSAGGTGLSAGAGVGDAGGVGGPAAGGAGGAAGSEAGESVVTEVATEASADSASESRAAALGAGEAKDAGNSLEGDSAGQSAQAADTSEVPNLLLARIPAGNEPGGGLGGADLPPDVVQALIESPVGSETTHSGGEPEALRDALDLEETAAATEGGGAQQDAVPEPVSLVLIGLGLSAVIRQRRAAR